MPQKTNPKIAHYDAHYGLGADNETEIRCPYCGHDHADLSDYDNLVSYWGQDDRIEFDCAECDQTFYIREQVRRTYTSFKAEA